jgi:hypothetical protein
VPQDEWSLTVAGFNGTDKEKERQMKKALGAFAFGAAAICVALAARNGVAIGACFAFFFVGFCCAVRGYQGADAEYRATCDDHVAAMNAKVYVPKGIKMGFYIATEEEGGTTHIWVGKLIDCTVAENTA